MGSADRRKKARSTKKRTARNQGLRLPDATVDSDISGNNDDNVLPPNDDNVLPPNDDNGPSIAQENIQEVLVEMEEALHLNFVINLKVLKDIINIVGKCPECGCDVLSTSINLEKKKGLAQEICLECPCGWKNTMFSSNRVNNNDNKSRFDINLRSVIAFREIGVGLTSIDTFCSHMNMPPPMTKYSYEEIINIIHPLYVAVAEESMNNAAATLRNNGNVVDIDASFDGTWQKRGFASLNGIVTCIERTNDKCVDIEVKTKGCKSCMFWEKRKGTDEYETWKSSHVCSINHGGSASSMESAGTVDIFKRSLDKRKLRYKTFIGDGDSSSYPSVLKADPYPGLTVARGECIGHVQKRVGTNLRKLRKELPKDRKNTIFGLNKLVDQGINYIQNCYGIAIRQNTGNLYQMKKSVAAIMFHCSDISDPEERHKWCLRTSDSWCSYWNTSKPEKFRLNLPPNIKDEPEIKDLFDRLRDESLLSKCLHGKTQNVNEGLNNMIWTKAPKRVYVNRKTLEICVSSAVLEYNEGKNGIIQVMKGAGLKIGEQQATSYNKLEVLRKRHMERKSSEPVKKRRKDIRCLRKGWEDKKKEEEGVTYESGGF